MDGPVETGILVELASTRADDAEIADDGSVRIDTVMLEIVAELMDREIVIDGFFATSEQQRLDLWVLREEVLETIRATGPFLSLDVSLPLSQVPAFLDRAAPLAAESGLKPMLVGHLGDGNIHYAVVADEGECWENIDRVRFASRIVDLLVDIGGSYSAEHGIGRAKADMLKKRKESSQFQTLRTIKRALDPNGMFGAGVLFQEEG